MAPPPALPRPAPHPVRIRPRVRDCDRRRAVRACWRCRDRKSRCIIPRKDGASPSPTPGAKCQRCLKNNWECIFADLPASGYVASDVGLPISPRSDGYVPAPSPDGLPHKASYFGRPRSLSDGRRAPGRGESKDAARLEVKNPHQTHYVAEVSNGQFLSNVQDAVVAESPVEVSKENLPSEYMQALDANTADAELLRVSLDGFPPRSVADFLVTTFFAVSEANYYYMDRERFKQRLARCYDAGLTPESADSDASFVCLALMVFAMGSQFAGLRAASRPSPQVPLSTKHGPGMVFYVKAKLLLSDAITQCSLESVQLCFLIGLFLLPSNTSDLSYVYHGMALRMAMSAGLHRAIVNPDLDQRVMHVRNRLWWSLYTSERRLTIILGRPESIREEDIDAPLPEFCEELDLPQAQDNICNLQQSIRLTSIYNQAVRLGTVMDFTDREAEGKIAEIKNCMSRWLSELPPRLQLGNLDAEQKSFRGAVHLHMTWNQITIYMGRAALLRRIQRYLHRLRDQQQGSADNADVSADASTIPAESSQGGAGVSNSSCNDERNSAAEAKLSRDCVAAAYNIIDLVRHLHDVGKLARFSFTDMNCCCTAAIIVMIHEIIRRHPLFASSMSAALQAMRTMASGCQNARYALKLIQNIFATTNAIKNKYPEPPKNQAHPDAATAADDADDADVDGSATGDARRGGADSLATGYEQWETWMAEAENWGTASARARAAEAPRLEMTTPTQGVVEENWAVGPTAMRVAAACDGGARAMGGLMPGGFGMSESAVAGYGPWMADGILHTGMAGTPMYTWPEDLNSLGLSGFGGLEFPNI